MTSRSSRILLGLLLALVFAAICLKLYDRHDRYLLTEASNTWFQGDLPRVYYNMVDTNSQGHYRVKVHPLHSLQTFPPAALLRTLGLNPYRSVQVVSAAIAGLWLLVLLGTLRAMGLARLDAVVFALLGASSSAALFWLTVPETYALGSVGILVCLWLAARGQQVQHAAGWHIAANAFALSATITNWMAGLACTFASLGLRRTVRVALLAFAIVTLLWGVQKYIFPTAVFFLGDRGEVAFIHPPTPGRLLEVLLGFFSHAIVMPLVRVLGDNGSGWQMLSVQTSGLASSGAVGLAATAAWALLLGAGIVAALRGAGPAFLRTTLFLTMAGQLALHAVYGEETFLYALHFVPLLVCLAALGALTRWRRPVVALAALAIPLLAANNLQQLAHADRLALSPRSEVLRAQAERPQGPWPRGTGHVVLAAPGSEEKFKAYHEPGGSFSPAVGSFGAAVWVMGERGQVLATSDTLALQDISQSLDWASGASTPHINTRTPHYQARWSLDGLGRSRLDLQPQTAGLSLMVRSVGPSGGAVRELHWDGQRLLINQRWSVRFSPAPLSVRLGREGEHDWATGQPGAGQLKSELGWAFARVELTQAPTQVQVHDNAATDDPWLPLGPLSTPLKAGFDAQLPDPRFMSSLHAQIAHMTMGLVRDETRPGEPTNYPLAWQRDGAYILAALARSGQLQLARKLSKDLARRDYFGGFGAEADAPGLAIWSLVTTARELQDRDYTQWVWPHIRRKAELIERMLTATKPVRGYHEGPVSLAYLTDPELRRVADAAKDGLIVGRMDHHRPLLFVNAVSYRGLRDAAELAQMQGETALAQRWLAAADKLQAAWTRALAGPENDNPRTYISALWPSGVASTATPQLQTLLQARWDRLRDSKGDFRERPLWTYFDVAEAHQWLALGQPERAWSTLDWFWRHQSSPGLYTWWEGRSEENHLEDWSNVRGWVRPDGVSPHYWTAAEVALLQLDMLAYQPPAPGSALVIGAGIPASWMGQPMQVRQLPVAGILVDWSWDGAAMTVELHGKTRPDVRLGPRFPPGAVLKVVHQPELQSTVPLRAVR